MFSPMAVATTDHINIEERMFEQEPNINTDYDTYAVVIFYNVKICKNNIDRA